jgi:hypothetical protein
VNAISGAPTAATPALRASAGPSAVVFETTRAPASRATRAVPSREPSSTTTTSKSPSNSWSTAAATVRPIIASASRAGMTMLTRTRE